VDLYLSELAEEGKIEIMPGGKVKLKTT